MPLPKTFPDARLAIEQSVRENDLATAQRIVDRLRDKAQQTRSREQEALAWFAKGILEDCTRRYAAAEQSLLVAVGIGRELFKSENESLGYIARSLGFVYAHLDRPEPAAEMFLLARNVFLKTIPHLAPEVVKFAASCNIALKLPDTALAIVHQELGASSELKAPDNPQELELYLVRARAFEDQNKPVQALKTYARLTQLLMVDPVARMPVVRGWLAIARIWSSCGDHNAAGEALAHAFVLETGLPARRSDETATTATALGMKLPRGAGIWPWRIHRVVGQSVAVGSVAHGLFFDTTSTSMKQLQIVAAEQLQDDRWRVRSCLKLFGGYVTRSPSWLGHGINGTSYGEGFEPNDEVQLASVMGAAQKSKVRGLHAGTLHLELPEFEPPTVFGRLYASWATRITAAIWAPGATGRPPGDDVIQQLLVPQ